MAKLPLLLLSILLLFSSCIMEDPDYVASQVELVEHSDITMEGARCVLNQNARNPITLSATTLSYWIDEERMEVEGLAFSQSDDEGNEDITGYAQRAIINTDTEIMELEGDVVLESISSSLSIRTNHLIFNTQDQRVDAEGAVSVTFEGGTVTGIGLSADLARMSLDLGRLESGEVEI